MEVKSVPRRPQCQTEGLKSRGLQQLRLKGNVIGCFFVFVFVFWSGLRCMENCATTTIPILPLASHGFLPLLIQGSGAVRLLQLTGSCRCITARGA